MKIYKLIPLLAILLAISSCSPIKVVTDKNKDVNFSKYKTYSFLGWQNNSDEILTETDRESLRKAFTHEFERRGLSRVNSGGDMQISLYIIVSDKSAVSGYSSYYGSRYSGYSYYGGSYGYGTNSYKQRDYQVGTLIMDVMDKSTKEQVWQAVASKTISNSESKRKRKTASNIRALMREFPVTPN